MSSCVWNSIAALPSSFLIKYPRSCRHFDFDPLDWILHTKKWNDSRNQSASIFPIIFLGWIFPVFFSQMGSKCAKTIFPTIISKFIENQLNRWHFGADIPSERFFFLNLSADFIPRFNYNHWKMEIRMILSNV